MVDYTFSQLNDKEFEQISLDLISIDKGKKFERFKGGRDGGVDGRFYNSAGQEEIVQCKHYAQTGYSGLISSLKKKNNGINEIDKVNVLAPKKYIFITSISLSRVNKDEIKNLFTPHIKSVNDIYGQENLNDLLSENKSIEEKYYKLWLSSTTVLNRIINNAIKGRSEHIVEGIQEKIKFYVITDNHDNVIKKLKDTHVAIIAGEPGIGKTTLAQQVALTYIEQGFEFFAIENLINEAESILEKDKKQIFYFDDFLGSNYLEAIESKKDTHITIFIERIKRDKNKRFILTSRTNIFNQGLALSDTFKSAHIESNELIIEIDTLNEMDKAKIFYNHIYHGNLKEEYKDELYKDKRYRHIIKHKNFNPRIIEFITKNINEDIVPIEEYWNYIRDKLNNPEEVWKNTFDRQSDDYIRALVILAVVNGNEIKEKHFKVAYKSYVKEAGLQNSSYASKEFVSIIEELVKYFLNRTIQYDKEINYSLFNPSIADFIINRYGNDEQVLLNALFSLKNTKALNNLLSLNKSKKINDEIYNNILVKLYDRMDISLDNDIDYTLELMKMANDIVSDKSKKIAFLQNFIDKPRSIRLVNTLLYFLEDSFDELSFNDNVILILIQTADGNLDIINNIINLITTLKIDDAEIISELNEQIATYLVYALDERALDIEPDDVEIDSEFDGDIYVKHGEIEEQLENILQELNDDVIYFSELYIDESSVINSVDNDIIHDNIIKKVYEMGQGDDYDRHEHGSGFVANDIDELFER